MPRYALLIEYDGGPFHGWQRQAGGQASVQGSIETALAAIQAGPHSIAGAGRTDAGVHATGQVCHLDLTKEWDAFKLMGALNWHLSAQPIAILDAVRVKDDFHARFSAIERRYLFRVLARRAPETHQKGQVWRVAHPLDIEAMRAGAAHLIGRHDFTTFRAVHCQAQSPVKSLDEILIHAHHVPGGIEYHFSLRARSFLHNQVRSIVGTLERVGAGSWQADDVRRALLAEDRAACGPVAPPQGLTMTGVGYPNDPFTQALAL